MSDETSHQDFLKDLPAISDKPDGFFDEVSREARQMRLRSEKLAQMGEISSEAMCDARKLEFELFSLRQRFRRKEIDRQDCVELINQLVMDFVIGTGELDQDL